MTNDQWKMTNGKWKMPFPPDFVICRQLPLRSWGPTRLRHLRSRLGLVGFLRQAYRGGREEDDVRAMLTNELHQGDRRSDQIDDVGSFGQSAQHLSGGPAFSPAN